MKLLKNKKLINIFISLCFVIGFNYYFFKNNLIGIESIFNFILLFIVYYFLSREDSNNKLAFIFGIILSLSLLLGQTIYIHNDIGYQFNSFTKIIVFIISVISFSKVVGEIVAYIFKKCKKIKNNTTWNFFKNKHIFYILWLFIFISWIPAFLAFYPGILSYDSNPQTFQASLGFSFYNVAHPPIHTFIWSLCLLSKSFIEPLVLYSLIQMLFLSFVFAYLIKFLIDYKINNWIILLSILFFSINPVIAIFSMIMTKDIYFSGFFVLFIIQIIKMVTNPKEYFYSIKNIIIIITIVLLMCLFRNNAIYIFLLFAPILLIIYRKYWKRIIIIVLIPIILYFTITSVVYNSLSMKKGPSKEILNVPIEQISYVVYKRDKTLDDATKNEILKYIEYDLVHDRFNYRLADPMKLIFKDDKYKDDKLGFYKLWLKLGLRYPKDYISSFLTLNLPYWYIDSTTNDIYSKRVYIETDMNGGKYYPVKTDSKAPFLLKGYGNIADYSFFEKIPLLSTMFSITLPFWILLFTLFFLIYVKKSKYILVLLPCFLLWLTYIVGPVSNFRYIFPIFILYPILFAFIFNSQKFKSR